MNIQPLTQTDYYKTSHYKMYPEGTTKIYSNLTPRKSRLSGVNHIVVFGIQYFILEYLIKQWNEEFFCNRSFTQRDKKLPVLKYKRMMDYTLGKDSVDTSHIEKLWELGYLPLEIKALPEGTLCPIGVPCLTITNTVDHAYWLVNYLETIMSCTLWQPITSATIAHEYRKVLEKYARKTTGDVSFVQWQGHDFSFRGMSSLESACTSGAGHLLSFTGTDTIPAISFLEQYYSANVEKELVGASVPATEHSVMCMGTKDDELGTFSNLLKLYPKGILSVVSDTWDLWKVCTEYLPKLKEQILARDGKLVIRPDSGDPVDIICGIYVNKAAEKLAWRDVADTYEAHKNRYGDAAEAKSEAEFKGVIELLWDIFGGTINELGYKVLDPHIGAIYGDSITIDRATQICERLKAKGFASTNIVLGIGSYTYQYNTRDTFGFAVKATYGEVRSKSCDSDCMHNSDGDVGCCTQAREIFKDPITDDGTKKSKKGLLQVCKNDMYAKGNENLFVVDQCTWEQEKQGELKTVFLNGKLIKQQTLSEIRERLNKQL
jgi:nicotinamide phosphoribosyltransferase